MAHFPRLVIVTDRVLCESTGRTLLETIAVLIGIADFAVLYREKDLDSVARRALARSLAEELPLEHLIVASDPRLAAELGAFGVHLARDEAAPPLPREILVGRSCHSADELLEDAEALDYATLSPVAASLSKPGYGPRIDDHEFERACASDLPVWALGGVTAANARRWIDLGASAIAVCGAVMGAAEPRAALAALQRAIT